MCITPHVYAAETAKVLPKNIFRARLVGIQTEEFKQKFNENGQLEDFSRSMNRSLTTRDFVSKNPKLGALVQAMNNVRSGSGDSLMNANLYSEFSLQVNTLLPALEYGLTDTVSLGIRIPIVKRKVHANFRAENINNATALQQQCAGICPAEVSEGLRQVGALNMNTAYFENAIFTEKGYETPHDFEKTEAGDLEFGVKYNFYKKERFYATVQIGARAPTGSSPSMTNVYDKGSGNGSWAAGLQTFQEYEATSYLNLGASQKVTHNFADKHARAVPRDSEDSLPSLRPEDDQVEDVKREQALLFETELSSTVFLMEKSISLSGAYQYLSKGADRYSGNKNLYYEGLAKNTAQERSAAELGMGYSTIPAFRKKKFSVPLEVQALYNMALSGVNVPDYSYVRMDMIVYF